MKNILSVFLHGIGKFLTDILPEDMKMDTEYFAATSLRRW
jgi:hypothetical protein